MRLVRPKVFGLTGGVTEIGWNCEAGDIYDVTLTKNYILRAPNGAAHDGQELTLRVKQDGTGGRTLNLHAEFLSSATNPVLATGPGAYTVLKFQYLAALDKWGLVSTGVWNL